MTTKPKTAPDLRFPGFVGAWWKKPLQDLTEKSITYGIVQTGDSVEGGVKCVRVVDLTKPKIILDELITTTEEISRSYKRTILVEGEIMIAVRGEIGLLALVTKNLERSNLTRGIARVAPKRSAVHPEYLVWALRSDDGKMEFLKQVNGSALKEIPINGLNKVEVQLTSLPEQRKIADFLTAVDGRIQQLSQKKALLEDYKKGVMQQLFTQALRFQDDHGNQFPDWEEKTLGDVTKWSSGGTPAKDKPEYWKGNIPWMTAASMHGRYYDDSQLKITPEGLRNGSRITQKGSILLLVRGSMLWNRIPVGIAIRDVAFNQDVKALAPSSEALAPFLLQWFIGSENKLLHTVVGTGIGAGKLDTDGMKSMELLLLSLPEQTKIANFLTALDRKIERVAHQITHTQAFKKGLLQQMFV